MRNLLSASIMSENIERRVSQVVSPGCQGEIGAKHDIIYLPGYAIRRRAVHFPGSKQLHWNGPGSRGRHLRPFRHFWPSGPGTHTKLTLHHVRRLVHNYTSTLSYLSICPLWYRLIGNVRRYSLTPGAAARSCTKFGYTQWMYICLKKFTVRLYSYHFFKRTIFFIVAIATN